jgi:hypothetical protein
MYHNHTLRICHFSVDEANQKDEVQLNYKFDRFIETMLKSHKLQLKMKGMHHTFCNRIIVFDVLFTFHR